MGFLGKALPFVSPAAYIAGAGKKKKPQGSLVNQYGAGGGRPIGQSMVGQSRSLY